MSTKKDQLSEAMLNGSELISPELCEQSQGGLECSDLYDCCSCGGNECGCRYCFDCNACEVCN